jgi:CheY-like chemotaxis protein
MGNRILLADKSITIQKIVQLTFADDNYQIQCVSDGQAALDTIPQFRPDLILADISLPVRSGYEICSIVRTNPQYSEFSSVPIVLLAGIYETMDEERAKQVEEKVRQVEATDFLSKPFDPQLLINKVKQHISGEESATQVESPVFAQETDTAIHFENEESEEAPPDDAEKTMMLPGGPFGSMFADSPPQIETQSEESRSPVDLESINPVGEVVFNEGEIPAVELGSEEESQETVNLSPASEDSGDAFQGREEQEFEFNESGAQQSVAPVQFVVPEAEEPFGDVFPEPAQAVQWTPPSEEDSPFGIPEPPPAPEPVAPAPELIESSVSASSESALKSAESASSAEVEGFDDTWPGVRMNMNASRPVEELFESDESPVMTEDVEELEPDFGESATEQEAETASEAASAPAQQATAQLSDELIDRIAEKVVNKLSERVVSEIVWQVVPDLAEKMIRRELEKLNAGDE